MNMQSSIKHEAAEPDAVLEEKFCKLIASRTGIVLQDHQLFNLRDTVRRGCAHFAFGNAAQYLHALQTSSGLTGPLEYLISGVTVGESYFFRDSEQIDLLRHKLLPEMIETKRNDGNLSLRIWSAGCSHGQEIYTIALLLQKLIPDIAKWRIHLLGTDINSDAVAKAMSGRYSEWSFRATPSSVRERWFTRIGREYEINQQIKRMVRFAYLNLTEDIYPSIISETNALDLILCRNVFIYLAHQAVLRSMTQFTHCLLDHGVLMLGASDPIEYKHTGLELVQNELVGYFRKNGTVYRQPVEKFLPIMPVMQKAAPTPGRTIQPNDEAREIVALLNASDWAGVLARVEEACRSGRESSELWHMKAKALASLGRTELALQACVRSLELDKVNKHTYLIQGLILSELDREQESEDSLRRALYLDRSFLEAHYELGMQKVRSRNLPAAIKSLETALKLALEGDPERGLHNAEGMNYRRFAQVLKNEIEVLRRVAIDKKPHKR